MEKAKLIGGVIGASALAAGILCGCCSCDCGKKCKDAKCADDAEVIVIMPAPDASCPGKPCPGKPQIKRMKKSEVLNGAQRHPRLRQVKVKPADSAQNPNGGDDTVTESFSIIAVEALPDAPAAAPAAAVPAKATAPAATPKNK